uniref:MYB family transcription factor n=1 Tax=Melilotus albus TaxID=47082 RepID=A0A896WCV2_MELAB|nr:MYB family transcription factor [Melilotus albus]
MVPMQFDHKMGFRDYILALEEEKKKIQVFPRDLPLSLELVTQAIETCKQQLSGTTTEYNLNGQSDCSEQTSTDEGLVFEEFIPIKKRALTPDFDEDDANDDDEQHSSHKMKSDWLRSVQLWNPCPPTAKEEVPRKTNVVEVKRNGGAFQPFHKEEVVAEKGNASEVCKEPTTSSQVPATSSTEPVVESSSKRDDKGQRKQRRCWSQELHKRFLHALQQLGGSNSATPKQIRELMKVDGLTNDEVKSHLQKFRLHTRRSPVIHNNTNSQTAPMFLVGNIYVQPQKYAAVATTTTVSGELTTVTTPTGIYAPVATHPPSTATVIKPKFKKFESTENSHSVERTNHSERVVAQSNSPASSCSTHTPSTSPCC